MFRNGLEPWHLLILLAIVLLMFGSTKLPELARGMGRSIRIFKSEMAEGKDGKDAEPAQIEAKAETTEAAPTESVKPEEIQPK
ncbi:MAG: Sec-independent protein translocase subunit TatA [Marmoricola sp.]